MGGVLSSLVSGRTILVALLVGGLLAPASSGAAGAKSIDEGSAACAGSLSVHSRAHLTGLEGTASASDFYAAPEHQNVTATLTVTPAESCTQDPNDFAEPGRARYSTADGSAVAGPGGDYQGIPSTLSDQMCVEAGQVPPHDPCPAGTSPTDQVSVTLVNDVALEQAVETFRFVLSPDPSSPPLSARHPTEAAVHVIDNDGGARVSLEPTLDGMETMQYEPREQAGPYHIPVFWAGSTGPSGSVPYEIGSALGFPEPTLDVDYRVESPNPLPASAFTSGGGRVAFIRLRIINDNEQELDEAISISLTGGNTVPDRDTATVIIRDAGVDTLAPQTRFHHPKHRKRYPRNAYQLREMHIFYREPGGAGIQKVQIAIQRKLNSGKCQWWAGKRFKGGKCGSVPAKFWKRTKYERALDWYLYRVPPFKPTVGTNVRFYQAFSRGFDLAGNVESSFQRSRNKNKFWVKRT